MAGRFLLDTNAIIAILENTSGVVDQLSSQDEVFIPAIVAGELYFGAWKSARVDENVQRLNRFLVEQVLVPCDLAVAVEYGKIKASLRRKGRPIPDNDLWVAAAAVRHSFTLMSRDRHFHDIDGLQLAIW